MRQVQFEVRPWDDGGSELVVRVNGVEFVELIERYERSEGFKPAGDYAGLSMSSSELGDLRAYKAGKRYPLLGCTCGDTGCWPLVAQIDADADTVTWSSFMQPHRPQWDYSGFGPFVFDRTQYDEALLAL
jgi:hypothetical protein